MLTASHPLRPGTAGRKRSTTALALPSRRPPHPGEFLATRFLKPLAMSANALAKALSVPAPRINDIARERRGVTADTAMRLARVFGTTAEYWMNLQRAWDLARARETIDVSSIEPLAAA